MRWEHPGTQRYFTREKDRLVRLRHKNANEHRSEVIHIPKHIVVDLFGKKGHRIDIHFRRTQAVTLPEYLAKWVLEKHKSVYKINGSGETPILPLSKSDSHSLPPPEPSLQDMKWSELQKLATAKGKFKPGMKKVEVIKALQE